MVEQFLCYDNGTYCQHITVKVTAYVNILFSEWDILYLHSHILRKYFNIQTVFYPLNSDKIQTFGSYIYSNFVQI